MNDYIIMAKNVKILFQQKMLEIVVFRYSYRFIEKNELIYKLD